MVAPRALLLILLAAPLQAVPAPTSVATLVELDVTPVQPVVAGGNATVGVRVQWPGGARPPHAIDLHAWLVGGEDAEHARRSGVATHFDGDVVWLDLPTRHAGGRVLRVAGNVTPGGSATASAPLDVAPDTITAAIRAADGITNYRTNLTIEARPDTLRSTDARLTVVARFDDVPALAWIVHDGDATLPWAGRVPWLARHGPGTYTLNATVRGADVETTVAALRIEVPDPPRNATAPVHVDVDAPPARIELTGDGVNADGKNKRPGEEVITRARVVDGEGVDAAAYAVYRLAETPVRIAGGTVVVDGDGTVEHRWAHTPLATGPHAVVLRLGGSEAARTFHVVDVDPVLEVEDATLSTWPGTMARTNVTITDANHGSADGDPGPVFGLPDVKVRLLRGSVEPGAAFEVRAGPWTFGTNGTIRASLLSWPDPGVERVEGPAGPGVRLPLVIAVGDGAEPGAYRLSLYHDAQRVAGVELDVPPLPAVHVAHAGDPMPGAWHEILVAVDDVPAGATANASLALPDGSVLWSEGPLDAPVRFDLPPTLPAGPVTATVRVEWRGGPPGGILGRANATVPQLPPKLHVGTLVDGAPVERPALHPAAPHVLEVVASASDPNGDDVDVTLEIRDWMGQPVPWPRTDAPTGARFDVPAGAAAGTYTLSVAADDGHQDVRVARSIVVGAVRRIAVDAELDGRGPPGSIVELGTVRVHNVGNVPLAGIGLSVDDSRLSISVDAAALNAPLPPGASRDVPVTAHIAAEAPSGAIDATLTVWGVAH